VNETFYQDDDERLWQRHREGSVGGSDVDAQEDALAERAIQCAAREAEATFGKSGGSVQGAEVLELAGGLDLPTFDGNTKDDSAKVPFSRGVLQYFPRALRHVAIISGGGAKKYDWDGWSEVEDGINRYRDAGDRHEIKHNMGEIFDPDHSRYCSEPVRHLGQKAWNALAVLELILREEEKGNE
jgi:hypothetical protein